MINWWVRLSSQFLPGERRSNRARKSLAGAYRDVFAGSATAEQAQIVLADMANHTGFYQVTVGAASNEQRAFNDGMRAAFGRIYRFLRLTEAELRELETAARDEAITTAEEGEI